MGIKERLEHKKSRIRENILNAARELFVKDGFDGVSMRRVAEKVEYFSDHDLFAFCQQGRIVPRAVPQRL